MKLNILKALKVAEKIIREYSPKLVVCVYHNPYDFVEIFNYIKKINTSYKVYIRHYTEGLDETVMYFVP